MAHQYIEAPKVSEIKNDTSVFLAGGISNCENWQKQSSEILSQLDELTVVNPRREDWKVDKNEVEESVKQISWEFQYIRKTTDIIFWFTDDTLQPISLYELGAALQRNSQYWDGDQPMEDEKGFVKGQRIFLGADPKYKRVLDVKVQAKLVGYRWPIRSNLNDLLEDFVRYYGKMKSL